MGYDFMDALKEGCIRTVIYMLIPIIIIAIIIWLTMHYG